MKVAVQLLDDLLASGAATLSMLYAGDQPVAAHLGLRSSRTLSWWFPSYDVEYQRYSPGRYLLLRIAEAEAARGIRYIDLGRGEEEYKKRSRAGRSTLQRAPSSGAAS